MTDKTRKTYPVDLIARYFLSLATSNDHEEDYEPLSHLKLQKLCYYAFGVASSLREENSPPLFEEPIEAWFHGPVVPELYETFKKYKNCNIPEEESATEEQARQIDWIDRKILDDVFYTYGQFTAWKLREMTHSEDPWKDSYNNNTYMSATIYPEKIRNFFIKTISEDYIESYHEYEQENDKKINNSI
ncbi:DUF4065 domain-containing protein [Candidatus Liberibacter solanacearum]|uniref:DUF4065 domain-containing protein n=1 Tax=Candidatus Liberibacter solanacearum TaxID=556287 RepID=A0A3R7NPG3_9HYPH|nr:type II toxin-antitoxin system antitoxin SocA domain-containing protein [Candidatus Liberibacter solanacearum]RPD36771.1 DUF4065 domain-containing protein [Candidatus Liberibacter solanacearum]